ncbi:MAG: shikimate dehydrogenase [Candidatus Melainabacteria bacterium]|jgi:shikimate dehydrogenase|nr:shikimate dehydrogenase [Candidatus Melainabacteria bacterium]
MPLGNKTQLFFSASSQPGNFGASVYNYLFKQLDIDAVYLPRKVLDAAKLIEAIRTLDISGCSISMPLKGQVIPYLDELEELSQATQSVNTITNKDGKLTGYNTDCYGAFQVIDNIFKPQSALVYGSGSVTASVITALHNFGCTEIFITARNQTKTQALADKYKITALNHNEAKSHKFELLINTTPASKDPSNTDLFELLDQVESLFDLPVSTTDTALIAEARKLGMKLSPGFEMSKYQLQKQFSIYTEIWPDIEKINEALRLNGFV